MTLSRYILKAGLYFIGGAAILIGSAIVVFGIRLVGEFFSAVVNLVYAAGPITDLGSPNDDSELRFYAVFFAAFGVLMVQSARHLKKYSARIPLLLALFFAGGFARVISYIVVGPPHALFILLMGIELIAPPLLWLAWRKTSLVGNTNLHNRQ